MHGWGYGSVDGIFDWIATYRRDSDISVRYGRFYQLATAAEPKVPVRDTQKLLRWVILCAVASWAMNHGVDTELIIYGAECIQPQEARSLARLKLFLPWWEKRLKP